MMTRFPTYRTFLAISLVLTVLATVASAQQDLYKSRAEMYSAAAANKQAEAAIIGAMATYGKSAAEAAKIQSEIHEKAIQNDMLRTETFYKKRAQYHAYKETHRSKEISHEEYTQRARRQAPAQLTSYHFDNESGDLRWPTLLKHAAYDALRQRIDHLLVHRTLDDSGAGSQNCVETLGLIEDLKEELRDNIRRYSSTDYLTARKFLESVAVESQRTLTEPAKETLDRVAER